MPKRRFASDTAVPVEQTRGEIEKLLRAEGAEGFGYSWEPKGDLITFRWRKANYLFRLPSIDKGAGSDRRRAQLDRQRWRALLLVIKAKVEAVAVGIAIFEEEFLAYVVTQDGTTVGELLVPRLREGKPLQLTAGKQ